MRIILGYAEENLAIIIIAAVLFALLLIVLWLVFRRRPSDHDPDSITIDSRACLDALVSIGHQMRANSEKLQKLENEAKRIQASVERVELGMVGVRDVVDDLLSQVGTYKAQTTTSHGAIEKQSKAVEPMPPALKEFCERYNIGVTNQLRRADLRQNYEKHYRIGVTNAPERRVNPETPPNLSTDTSGNYLAFYIEAEDLHAVVPQYGLTIQDSIYGPGAFGEVFDCPNFDVKLRYQDAKVIRPAILEPDTAREHWTPKEKGKLDLGLGY